MFLSIMTKISSFKFKATEPTEKSLESIDENDIRNYLQLLVQKGHSHS